MLIIPSLALQPDLSRSYVLECIMGIQEWERAGFGRFQLQLPGGPEGPEAALRAVEDILRDVHCPVQVAGRLESSEDLDAAFNAGASFAVIGGRALDELDWLAAAAGRFPGLLILSTPARERRARTRGALRTLPLDLRDLAEEVASLPLAGIVVEFAADTVIAHAELALLEDVAEAVGFPVQCTGGSPDLGTLRDLEFRGVAATIIPAAHLSAEFDGQTLARDFLD